MDYINPLGLGAETSFAAALQRKGHDVSVVPIQRSAWLNIAKAVFTLDFWKNDCKPSGLFGFYLDECVKTINMATAAGQPVVLVGHSEGGWLARALLTEEYEKLKAVLAQLKAGSISVVMRLFAPHCAALLFYFVLLLRSVPFCAVPSTHNHSTLQSLHTPHSTTHHSTTTQRISTTP
jgi:hypothetical protein